MSFQSTVLYHRPEDPAAFDAYYESKTTCPWLPGSPGCAASRCRARAPAPTASRPLEYLVAAMQWDDQTAFATALATPEGQATSQDRVTSRPAASPSSPARSPRTSDLV